MLQEIQIVGSSVLTLFLLMAVGFVLGKLGLLSGATLTQISKVLLCVVTPSIMIDTFLHETCDRGTVRQLAVSAAVLAGTYVLNMVLAALCYRRTDADDRGVMRFAAIYGNTGFMGIPLIQSVLGSEAMTTTVISLAVFNVTTWTHGQYLMGGRSRISPKRAVLNPGVIGFLIAVLLFALPVELPKPITATIGFVGDLNTPLAMLVIGGQMAAVDLRELVYDRRLYGVSALKLLVVPALAMLVLLPFGLDEMTYVAVAILAGCPVAGATSLFCQMAGKDSSLAARAVSQSTLLCIITLPLVTLAAKLLAGV